jgi:hypothetical protein
MWLPVHKNVPSFSLNAEFGGILVCVFVVVFNKSTLYFAERYIAIIFVFSKQCLRMEKNSFVK